MSPGYFFNKQLKLFYNFIEQKFNNNLRRLQNELELFESATTLVYTSYTIGENRESNLSLI